MLRPELDLGRPGLTTGTCDGRFFGPLALADLLALASGLAPDAAGLAAPCEHAPSTRANAITTTNGDRLKDPLMTPPLIGLPVGAARSAVMWHPLAWGSAYMSARDAGDARAARGWCDDQRQLLHAARPGPPSPTTV